MNSKVKILVVDDEESIRETLRDSLSDEGFLVRTASSGTEGLFLIQDFEPSIVLLDIWMPGSLDGIEVLQRFQQSQSRSDFIMMSGHGTIETAVKATRLGAWDFVEKPLSMDKILIVIERILAFQNEKGEKEALLNQLRRNIAMIGASPEIMEIKQRMARLASVGDWGLIVGEVGSGRGLLAENLHYMSPRAGYGFFELNISSVPRELQETELFGCDQLHLSGNERVYRGRLELAHGGTLMIQDADSLEPLLQAKLLDYLSTGFFCRKDGEDKVSVDVRLFFGTKTNLLAEVQSGAFNESLYQRLGALKFEIPPLRERIRDIPLLVEHFSSFFATQSSQPTKSFRRSAMSRLEGYQWPGNVLELRNFIERVYILVNQLDVSDLDLDYVGFPSAALFGAVEALNFREARARFERDFLIQMLQRNSGNISKTAEMVGLERSYLHRKLKTFELDRFGEDGI